tara:strand:+ start:721 stop:1251 length:531 start_codon:yes stop_codon:yes gene_type:complete
MADEIESEEDLPLDVSNKKKKLLIIVAIMIVLIGSAGAYFFFSGSDKDLSDADNDGQSSSETIVKNAEQRGVASYVILPQAFRFNASGAVRDKFIEIKVQLLVRGDDNEQMSKKHIPLLESTLLKVFLQANADDLATSQGKATLKQKSLIEVQNVMKELTSKPTIERVLFTGFIMQ